MSKTVTTSELEANLRTLLDDLAPNREALVEEDGTPTAVVLSPQQYAELRRGWAWSIVDRIHEQNKDVDPNAIWEEVMKTVEEVRREHESCERTGS
jgi:hypothetical protein